MNNDSENYEIMFFNNELNKFIIEFKVKYFKDKQGKCIRRSLKGSKVFINFLKNLYFKKYFLKKNFTVFSIIGFDYNLIVLKKSIKGFFLKTQNKFSTKGGLFLLNIKTSFSKKI